MADTLYSRFQHFVKANEKLLIVVLLALIAPAFGFTWIMQDVMRDPSRRVWGWIGGEKITIGQWRVTFGKLRMVNQARPPWRSVATSEQVLEHLTLLREADRRGIQISEAEFKRKMRDLYRGWVARDKIAHLREQDARRLNLAFAQAFEEAKWDPEDYRRRVAQMFDEPPSRLESTMREWLRVQKLKDGVSRSVFVSDRDAYASWAEENEERRLALVRLRPDDEEVLEAARRRVTDEEIRKRYEEKKDAYRSALRIRFAYAKAPLSTWDAEAKVTDEELRKAYVRLRPYRFRRPEVISPAVFDVLTEEERAAIEDAQYRPFEQVREEVAERERNLKRQQAAYAFFRGVLAEILLDAGAGADAGAGEPKAAPEPAPAAPRVDLEAIAARHPELTYGETPWFGEKEAKEALGDLFTSEIVGWFRRLEKSPDRAFPGTWRPRRLVTAEVVYVIAEKPQVEEPEPLDLDAARDLVRDEIARERAKAVAEDLAREKAEALRKGALTFEAAAAGRTVFRTERLRGTARLEVDGLDLPEAASGRVLDAAFREGGEGDVVGPIGDGADGWILVRVEEVVPPNPEDFTGDLKRVVVRRLLGERRQARLQEWMARVRKEYPITRPRVPSS